MSVLCRECPSPFYGAGMLEVTLKNSSAGVSPLLIVYRHYDFYTAFFALLSWRRQ